MRSARAVSIFVVSASLLGGCGLVLDLDPPDPTEVDAGSQTRDAAVDPDDAGALDGAIEMDASAGRDGGPSDAGHDAAPPDASPAPDAGGATCASALDCSPAEHCARPPGRCFGPGECRARPLACPDVADPVCGCDWSEHANPCEASAAGTGVMQAGACPTRTFDTEWCDREPAAPSEPAGCARCFDDRDCGGLAPICVASACVAGGEGLCALGPPPLGDCYDERQCRPDERCAGAVIDVCPPRQGVCVEP